MSDAKRWAMTVAGSSSDFRRQQRDVDPAIHDPSALLKYLDALRVQAKAEKSSDHDGARKASAKAESIFFTMSPSDQTAAARQAKRESLA